MLLLASTSDELRIVTVGGTVALDVHASWVDYSTGTVAPGRTNTVISTATTTTVVASPAASTQRNIRYLSICNTDTTASVTITVEHFDGSNAITLETVVLGAEQVLYFTENGGFSKLVNTGGGNPTWAGVMAACYGSGDPADTMRQIQCAGNVAATPTNISTTVARCSAFMLPADMTVNRIRAFGVGITTNVYRVALYRYSDLARLTAELPFSTAVDTWVSIGSALNVSLSKNVLYFVAVSVNATGTTAGLTCSGGTVAATTGRVNTAPNALPGSLALSSGAMQGFRFQFAVTAGALPNPANTLVAQAAWTGGIPAFWIDSVDT